MAVVCGVVAVAAVPATASGTLRDRVSNGVEIQAQNRATGAPAEFVAIARGALPGTLEATILHGRDRLPAGKNMKITGGTFEIGAGPEGTVTGNVLRGKVFAHGGDGAAEGACPAKASYRVVIALDLVLPKGTVPGSFRGTLTHYSSALGGSCQPYAASLRGTLSFSA